MFCLRSWIPILFFLSTNASPVYLILFITATYVLNRPCVYCSILLAILVLSLYDFHSSWFPPYYSAPSPLSPSSPSSHPHSASSGSSWLSSLTGGLAANASSAATTPLPLSGVADAYQNANIVFSAMNATAEALFNSATEEVKKRIMPTAAAASASAESTGAEWVRHALAKKEWRVPCLDVLIRL